jgi:hypothetical protein
MKMYGEIEAQLHTFLNSALDACEWTASCPSSFTPRKRDDGIHWIGDWVDPQSQYGCSSKEKNPCP